MTNAKYQPENGGKWKMEFTLKLSRRHSLDINEAHLEGVVLLIRQ